MTIEDFVNECNSCIDKINFLKSMVAKTDESFESWQKRFGREPTLAYTWHVSFTGITNDSPFALPKPIFDTLGGEHDFGTYFKQYHYKTEALQELKNTLLKLGIIKEKTFLDLTKETVAKNPIYVCHSWK